MTKKSEPTIIRALKAGASNEVLLKMQELKDQERLEIEKRLEESKKPFTQKVTEKTQDFILEHWFAFLTFVATSVYGFLAALEHIKN